MAIIGSIKKHEIRKLWKNEATDFTTWLELNISVLSEAVGFELVSVKREHEVGSFSADLVAKDEAGNNVVIENQLERTDHGHLGQIITYVSNLDAKTLIWISSEPRQEHINAINWLNTNTPVDFYLVRLEAISVDNSNPAPLFQVICRPDEEIRSAAAAQTELSERERFNIQFWSAINEKCKDRISGFSNRKPPKYHYHQKASGKSGFGFVFLATSKYFGIELYIDTQEVDLNKSLLAQLESQRKSIESEFGHKLHFDNIPEKRACRIRYVISEGKDVMDLEMGSVQETMIEHMILFEKVLKPRIQKLDFSIGEAA